MQFISHLQWQQSEHFNGGLKKEKQAGNNTTDHWWFTSQKNAQRDVQWWGLRTKSLTAHHPWQWRAGLFILMSISIQILTTSPNKHPTPQHAHIHWKQETYLWWKQPCLQRRRSYWNPRCCLRSRIHFQWGILHCEWLHSGSGRESKVWDPHGCFSQVLAARILQA